MSRLSLLSLALLAISAAPLAGGVPADSTRSRESFNQDWRFARFGAMPDGARRMEPGGTRWSIQSSASSEETDKGNTAALAMDGDPATRWCATSGSPDQWLMLDLGMARDLGSIAIRWEAAAAYRFAVEGSQDGQQWQMLADKTQNSDTAQPMTVALSGQVRFVRVRTTGLPPEKWASISEIALTDAQHYVIPDIFSLGGTAVGIAFALLPGGLPWWHAVLGAALGYGLLWFVRWAGDVALRRGWIGGEWGRLGDLVGRAHG
ncbi:MAG: discoidin domain-containing protein [Verrucomicrobiota bacterium]